MGFANPLAGRIQAKEEAWQGTPTFRVTSTFAEHVVSGRGPGIDFGNGRCGDPVYACEAGTVRTSQDPNGALVIRVHHTPVLFTGYAHLAVFAVADRDNVTRGQLLGMVGSTGADACHLHWGVNQNGVEVDGWLMLDQNQGDDMQLKGRAVQPFAESSKRMVTMIIEPAGVGVVRDPTVQGQPYDLIGSPLPFGKSATIDWVVTGNDWHGDDGWYGLWLWTNPPEWGYVPKAACGPLQSAESIDQDALHQAYNDGLAAAQAAVEALEER